MAKAEIRMTEGPIGKQLVSFAVPLFLGFLFQQLYNTADALIVGNMLGNSALAAVTGTGTLIFLLVGFFGGISMGAGVVVSRYFGAREVEKMRSAIHTNIAFGLAAGVFLTVVGMLFTPQILQWMGTPEDVMPQSVSYIRTYFAGSIGLVMYNQCRGVMQAVGDSRHPLYYLIISSITNVVLDILLIGVFKMDVDGAALATIISQFVSVFLCMGRLMSAASGEYRVQWREIRFDPEMTRMILAYGLPSGLQNSVIALANVVVQSNINAYGEMAMSGCGAYGKVEGFAFLPITSFTAAITTFVGQNLGAGELKRTRQGARFGILCSVVIAEVIGLLLYWLAPLLIRALYAGACGHRLRRPEDAYLLAVLLPAGAYPLPGSSHARRRPCRHPHDLHADLLVRGSCRNHLHRHPHLPQHRRGELGLPHHVGVQQHFPYYLLLQGRLADRPEPPQRPPGAAPLKKQKPSPSGGGFVFGTQK